jgi:hypothetical protein
MLRATDLRAKLAVAIAEYRQFLGFQLAALKEKQFDLKLVADGLYRESGKISATERVRLLRITGDILDVLASQSGDLRGVGAEGVSHA